MPKADSVHSTPPTNTSPLPPSIELQMALHPIGGGSMPSLLP
jgi:hypothetical protein